MPEAEAGRDGNLDVDVDVLIRGAGPVGCVLALALHDSGLRVRLAGRIAGPAQPANASSSTFRPLALSYASRLILERIGAWDSLSTTPIEKIHVSQAGAFGRTKISREDVGLPALGYVVDYAQIASHLASRIDNAIRVEHEHDLPAARLVVHAEGSSGEEAKGRDYGHTAIVAAIECEPPSHGTAWERFTSEGPLALLPLKRGYGLVWSRSHSAAATLMEMSDIDFLQALQAAFGTRAGTFRSTGPRAAMPLTLRYRPARVVAGEVHIGNAAQTLHPVAGQGLNLGLRDAWDLARLVRAAPSEALGSISLAQRFSHARRIDAQAAIRATDLMATLYVRRDPLSSALRGAALTALDLFPPARKAFARRMIYGASAW
jgi:2-octaprenyl-6-methoxyphenol hydroxylase